MRRAGLALALALAFGCGEGGAGPGPDDCVRPEDPGPMSPARARLISPEVGTGLALSTTHIHGDCRPRPASEVPLGPCGDPRCRRERAALFVTVVPANSSVPLAAECGDAPRAEALAPLAAASGFASERGEIVFPLPEGAYRPFLSRGQTGCAPCGDPGEGVCLVEVEAGEVAARDLVLDEAAH